MNSFAWQGFFSNPLTIQWVGQLSDFSMTPVVFPDISTFQILRTSGRTVNFINYASDLSLSLYHMQKILKISFASVVQYSGYTAALRMYENKLCTDDYACIRPYLFRLNCAETRCGGGDEWHQPIRCVVYNWWFSSFVVAYLILICTN